MRRCQDCGEESSERARFCASCGTKLPEVEAPARELRKTVTIVFSDLAGSTSMGESLDPESLRRVMLRYYTEMRFALERHGGTVEKFIGDAVMAVFGIPTLHEDDALRAVRAAHDMKRAMERLNEELSERWGVRLCARTGVNTGEVVAGDPTRGEGFVVGDAVNVAARLEQNADGDDVLIGEETYHLVEGAVTVEEVDPLTLKGKAEPVPAYRLIDVSREGPTRRMDSPLVGRERELSHLRRAFEQVENASACRQFTVVGPAGVGKSRLTLEFLSALRGDATIVRGRCLSYGEGITYWPLAEVVKEAAGILDDDSPEKARSKIADLLPLADPGPVVRPIAGAVGLADTTYQPDETFWAVKRLFEALARARPLVVVFDDVHWAEETFLDLVEYLTDAITAAPVMLLCLGRPELRDVRPSLLDIEEPRDLIVLEPLGDDHSHELIENLLGRVELPEQLSGRIAAAAEGNPLFVEETLRMLVDQGQLRREDGAWEVEGDISEIGVPATIEALVGARLDRLGRGERVVMERASVIGQEFWLGAVSELSPKVERPDVPGRLDTLVEKELVQPGGQSFAGENAYRFGHILIRDVAYAGMLKEGRSLLHERFAGWLEDRVHERVGEYQEILGYHLEQAFRYREELAPVDSEARKIALRAFRYLSTAGTDAHARGDMPAAVKLLERSIALLAAEDPGRLELMLKLAQALCHIGDFDRARTYCSDTAAEASHLGDRAIELHALMERADMDAYINPEHGLGRLREVAEEAIPLFQELKDETGLARSWRALSIFHSDAARWGAATEALEQALGHAHHAGDRELYTQILGGLATALSVGPKHVEAAMAQLQQVLAGAADAPDGGMSTVRVSFSTHALLEAWGLASLSAMSGDFQEARRLCTNAKEIVDELGQKLRTASLGVVWGRIEVLADDPERAEAVLRESYEILAGMGDKNVLSTVAAELAEVVLAQGRQQEAHRLAKESEALAAPDDVESQIRWRAVSARLLATRGEPERGEAPARWAVGLAAGVEFPNLEACAALALAEVLRMSGRAEEAASYVSRALALYESKGNLVSARKAQALLADLRPGGRTTRF